MLGLELGLLLLDQTVDPVQVDLDRLANRHASFLLRKRGV